MGFFSKLAFWRKKETKTECCVPAYNPAERYSAPAKRSVLPTPQKAWPAPPKSTVSRVRRYDDDSSDSNILPAMMLMAAMEQENRPHVSVSHIDLSTGADEPVKFDSSLSDERLGSDLSNDGIRSILDETPTESFSHTSSSSDLGSDWGSSSHSSSSDWSSSSSSDSSSYSDSSSSSCDCGSSSSD